MDRFERLFALPENQYMENAPLILSAGVLLKDSKTDRVLVQLKFQNVSGKPITAVKVSLTAKDITGAELEGIDDYQYLDLWAEDGWYFGADKAILLPDKRTRSFGVCAVTAVFMDDEKAAWNEFQSLPEKAPLIEQWKDDELVKQYRLETNAIVKYFPQESMGLWMCTCGTWNRYDFCTQCRGKRNAVFRFCNEEILHEKLQKRVEQEHEKQRQAEAARKAAQDAEDQAKLVKEREKQEKRERAKAHAPLYVAIIIAIIAICFALRVLIPLFFSSKEQTQQNETAQVTERAEDSLEAGDSNSIPEITEIEDDESQINVDDIGLEDGAFKEICRAVGTANLKSGGNGWYLSFSTTRTVNEHEYYEITLRVYEDDTADGSAVLRSNAEYDKKIDGGQIYRHILCSDDRIEWNEDTQCYEVYEIIDRIPPKNIRIKLTAGKNGVYIEPDSPEDWEEFITASELPLWLDAESNRNGSR